MSIERLLPVPHTCIACSLPAEAFEEALPHLEFHFRPKAASPCRYYHAPDEGVVIAFRASRFRVICKEEYTLRNAEGFNSNQVAMVLLVEDTQVEKVFAVAATHLKAKPGFEAQRLAQLNEVIEVSGVNRVF